MSEHDPQEVLLRAKKLVAEGKIKIGNEAAIQGGRSVSVASYARHNRKNLPRNEGGVLIIQWSRPGIGFGELTLYAKNGKLCADTECMNDQFVLDVVRQALEEREEIG